MTDLKTSVKMAVNALHVISILAILLFVAFQLIIDGMVLELLAYSVPEMAGSLAELSMMLPWFAVAIFVFISTHFTEDIVNRW